VPLPHAGLFAHNAAKHAEPLQPMTQATVLNRILQPQAAPVAGHATALVLMGGGARTAYQAGVLKGIVRILELQRALPQRNPFPVVVGTSAGSINATFFACRCLRWRDAIDAMEALWGGLHTGDIYRADLPNIAASGFRWLSLMALGWLVRRRPRALLDNTPLAGTLNRALDFPQLDEAITQGALHALAVTASSYTSGEHISFVQGTARVQPWSRPGRRALLQSITVDHLLASSAIPFVFPATPLWVGDALRGHSEYFGDGSMRQLSPLSPAIHLGASKILAIGVGRAEQPAPAGIKPPEPSLAQIAGHSMATVFFDTLRADAEQTQRLNDALAQLPASIAERLSYRPVDVLLFLPSQPLEKIASDHVQAMPKPVRGLLRALGATEVAGAGLASYLLFEPEFTTALIELGERDAFERKAQVLKFFDVPQ
jgi:NTE family protein